MSTSRPPTTRERILLGAADVVTNQGIRGTTVQHILAAAGVSRRTFYQYFPGIEGVLRDLYIEQSEAIIEAVTEASGRGRVDAYIDAQETGGRLLVLLQAEAGCPDSLLAPVREAALDALVELLFAGADPLVMRGRLIGAEGLMARGEGDAAWVLLSG